MTRLPEASPGSRCLSLSLLSSFVLLHAWLAVSQAQLTLDGSLGPRGPLAGPDYRIGAELGQIRGGNLFHSFEQFNVPAGGSATFAGPNTIANILSRVTGGQPSSIDGILRSEIAGANLYLLNPSGVLFGAGARLEVSGSFHVSTADALRLADGATFHTNLAQGGVLTVAPPTAFGFLGPTPAPITIQGSTLQVSEGKALSVVGGDLTLVYGRLHAPGGRLQLASVASPGDVVFSPLELAPDLQVNGFARLGRIALTSPGYPMPWASLDVSGERGGTVLLRSGRLFLDHTAITADTHGTGHQMGLGIDLRIAADALIQNSVVSATTLGTGRAGDLLVIAGELHMNNATIASGFPEPNQREGGNVTVQVGQLTMTRSSGISSTTFGQGPGGQVTVTATESIVLRGGGISDFAFPPHLSSYLSGTSEHGPRVVVSAPTVRIEGGSIWTSGGFGNAPNIEVQAGRLTLIAGGAIGHVNATFVNQGGTVIIRATEAITITGRDVYGTPSQSTIWNFSADGGRILISAPTLRMERGVHIGSSNILEAGLGRLADIEVQVGQLTLTEGAKIVSLNIGEGGAAQVGHITITATESIFIGGSERPTPTLLGSTIPSSPSGIFNQDISGSPEPSTVVLSTPILRMEEGAQIAGSPGVSIFGGMLPPQGRAADLSITAGTVTLTGGAAILSSTPNVQRGGNVTIVADRVRLADGAVIAATSSGLGDAGSLRLTARDTFESTRSTLTTAATQASGGNIELRARSRLRLRDSALTTSVQGGAETAGGNLTIGAPAVIVAGSQILATAVEGRGGTIGIGTDVLLADPTSLISASSTLGISGTVDIQAPVTALSGTLAPLPQAVVQVATLLPARCAARFREGTTSSLALGGRGGLPPEPGGVLPSPLVLDERLAADLAPAGAPQRQQSAARFALLAAHEQGLPRLTGDCRN
jgi:filamentous hemagglutinin family protein